MKFKFLCSDIVHFIVKIGEILNLSLDQYFSSELVQ